MVQYVPAARHGHGVEDGDEPPWTQHRASSGQSVVLRADQFHRSELQNSKLKSKPKLPKEECKGIKVNIWNRSKVYRYYLNEIRCI